MFWLKYTNRKYLPPAIQRNTKVMFSVFLSVHRGAPLPRGGAPCPVCQGPGGPPCPEWGPPCPECQGPGPPVQSGGPPVQSGGPPYPECQGVGPLSRVSRCGPPPVQSVKVRGPPCPEWQGLGTPLSRVGGPLSRVGGPLSRVGGPLSRVGGPSVQSRGAPCQRCQGLGGPPVQSGGPPCPGCQGLGGLQVQVKVRGSPRSRSRSGVPPGQGQGLSQGPKRRGRGWYASCGHAGGLSCFQVNSY